MNGQFNLLHFTILTKKVICINHKILDASFEFFTAVIFQVEVFWMVTPCSVVIGYQRFGGP